MGNCAILGTSADSENISNICGSYKKKKGCDSEASYGTSTKKSYTILGKQSTHKQFKHFLLLPLYSWSTTLLKIIINTDCCTVFLT